MNPGTATATLIFATVVSALAPVGPVAVAGAQVSASYASQVDYLGGVFTPCYSASGQLPDVSSAFCNVGFTGGTGYASSASNNASRTTRAGSHDIDSGDTCNATRANTNYTCRAIAAHCASRTGCA